MIRLTPVHIDQRATDAAVAVLRSGRIAQGEEVAAFEREFAAFCSTQHAVAVSSGTTALTAALIAIGMGTGDEVITNAFSFAAVANAALSIGATARFADVSERDFMIDATTIRAVVTPRTKAIVPVHLFGQSAAMDDVREVAAEHDLSVIEDAAQSHGSEFERRRVGGIGRAGCFSFYATKNITTGEGGMVTTDDDDIADQVRILRNQGMRGRYQHVRAGFNWRLTDMQAAIGRAQLSRYDDVVARRQRHAAALSAGLADVPGVAIPCELPRRRHVWHLYTLRIAAGSRLSRDELQAALALDGIETAVHYPKSLADIDVFTPPDGPPQMETSVARRLASEVLAVPVHQGLSDADVDHVVERIRVHLT